jgi:hypothetical protein
MQEYTVAVEDNGDKFWYQNGKFHRLDGPAVEYADGHKTWYQYGKYHRLDGPAIEGANGYKVWHQNGKLHREDGPAIEYASGDKSWYQNGKRHRLDGPAIEYDRSTFKAWYIEGQELTEEEFNNRNNKVEVTLKDIAKAMNIDIDKLRIKEL